MTNIPSRIAFFTEGATNSPVGPLDRNQFNCRVDIAWRVALKADHYNLYSRPNKDYDLGIFIIPKNCGTGQFDLKLWKQSFEAHIKPRCKMIAVMQEGPSWFFQDMRVDTQFTFIEFLSSCDLILCHNEIDAKYYSGLIDEKQVEILPSLMIEDSMPQNLTQTHERCGVMIGGNFTAWYSGIDSYVIAQGFEEQIFAPSMGRKQKEEDWIEDICSLPYMNWQQWITELSKRKYAVHLMRTYAAGTFALNAARLKIPTIGYNSLDTQRICFPELSVDEGDLVSARKKVKHLKENILFYEHCAEYAFKAYTDHFSEKTFLERFNSYF